MNKILLAIFLLMGTLPGTRPVKSLTPVEKNKIATCVGANPCKACKNCKYCKRCAKNGLTCGVCKK
jgi:hypothetical protein